MTFYPRGSEWRIWDLHVHTPDSITHNYTGEDKWGRFLEELAHLPPDLKVLGINDYWFLDGYKRVRAEFDGGRFPNLEAVFPVLEVRCDTFSGTDGHLARLNLHMICDPLLSLEEFDSQLRPLMQARYRLTNSQAPVVWSEFVTKDSLSKLGSQVIAAAPEEMRPTYPGPLETGFASLNVSFEKLRSGIAENSAIKDHVLLALGKVEWTNIKWSQQSAAHKKTFINSVDAVFTAAPSRDAFSKSLASLREAEVNHRLLDCSDAHGWSVSDANNRLGNCLTWINADPTFKGLRQALQEYEHRVCVDDRPAVLTRQARSPQSVATDVRLGARADAAEGALFDSSLPLNPGLVVVIGNKGQGKSALLDSMALAANSDRQDDFSFLTADRFRSAGGREASKYQVTLTWANGQSTTVGLDGAFDRTLPVRVDYLPQSLIEKVCSADPDSVEKRAFEAEIERVVFRHIDDAQRGVATSLSQLLEIQGASFRAALTAARSEVAAAGKDIAALHHRAEELAAMGLAARETELLARLETLENELATVTEELNSAGSTEQQGQAKALQEAVADHDRAATAIVELSKQQRAIDADIETTTGQGDLLLTTVAEAQQLAEGLAARLGVAASDLLQVHYNEALTQAWVAARTAERQALRTSMESAGGLNDQVAVAHRKVQEQEEMLQALSEEMQSLVQRQSDLRAQHERVHGEPAEPETLRGIRALIAEEQSIPGALFESTAALETAFRDAHGALKSLMDLQKTAYEPATRFVHSNDLAASVELAFDVEFRVRGFADRWLSMVNRQKLGNFFDLNRSDRDKVVLHGAVLGDSARLFETLNGLVERLRTEGGSESGKRRPLDSIMRSAYASSDLLSAIYSLEWLQSQYIIRSEGSELSELSPGQRGLVLLLFYLLVDKSERPLLLDQPEENLDNQTVRNVLVPALREAVSRRQVIAVTHNPNFAVVGDADQIIVAEVHGQFTYRSGSLAELAVGTSTIDVLEGTRAAFTSRQFKYNEVVGTE